MSTSPGSEFAQDALSAIQQWEMDAIESGAGPDLEIFPVGPFRALVDRHSDLIWINMVIPVEPIGPDSTIEPDVARLRDLFRQRNRTLRFEFNEGLYPDLAGQLERNGLALQLRQPLMAGDSAGFRPLWAPGIATRILTAADPERLLDAFLSIRRTGFGEAETASTQDQIADLRAALAGKNRYGLAELDGVPAGTAVLNPISGVAEMVGVATLPHARRRGVAATLCSRMIQDHFNAGGRLVWLDAADERAQALYERLGFVLIGSRLNYSDRYTPDP